MLNGIGGRSIQEAKQNLTYDEVLDWSAYIKQRGQINIGQRLEIGFALLAMLIIKSNGGKADMEDFMPHFDKAEADIESVMSILAGKRT